MNFNIDYGDEYNFHLRTTINPITSVTGNINDDTDNNDDNNNKIMNDISNIRHIDDDNNYSKKQ